MPIVLKSGSLNPLEPSGPVQARNGIEKKIDKTWRVATFLPSKSKGHKKWGNHKQNANKCEYQREYKEGMIQEWIFKNKHVSHVSVSGCSQPDDGLRGRKTWYGITE